MTGNPPGLRFELLGPLRVHNAGTPVNLGPLQQQVVLAALLLNANRPLSRTALVEAIWGAAAPASAINLIQRHVSGLRRVLEPDRTARAATRQLVWTGPGYVLNVESTSADLPMFEAQLSSARSARRAGDLAGAAKTLHSALRLWRGPVCDGLDSPLLTAERVRLAERRISAVEERIDLDLLLDDDADVISELRRLIIAYPLRERPRALLMHALYRAGRQGEALAAFHDTRRTLLAELGVEPGQQLRDLHEQILRSDPALHPVRTAVTAGAALTRPPTPAQLPRGAARFSGRQAELQHLQAAVDNGRIALVVGTPGVGKTALALHWAHQVRDQFPDGQLYVNLRGFEPSRAAMEPSEALCGFLEALGVSPALVPTSVGSQAALYRSLMQQRQVLIVLDNARDAEQVRPLLPGSSACRVLVTSRNTLSGLVAQAAADPLRLDVLSPDRARQLLAVRIGAERIEAEPAAVDEIIQTCAGLPLALAIVGARAVAQPGFPLAAVAEQLRESMDTLDAFVNDDELTDVGAVISWSYEALDPAAARLFRLMSLHPGPDLCLRAAATLLGAPLQAARSAMAALTNAHLVQERAPGRFGFHDLLRAYSGREAGLRESPAERRSALHRVAGHYLCTA